jgi:hypothetical protein
MYDATFGIRRKYMIHDSLVWLCSFFHKKMKYWVSGKRMTTEKIQMLYGSLTDFGDFNEERAGLKLLPFDTEMAVEVVAFNDHFDSLPSNIVRFRTPKGGFKIYLISHKLKP